MRKDVKIGLAVGGILLTVLIVYVLKVPSNPKDSELLDPKAATPADPEIALVPSTQPVAVVPTTQPLITDPFASASPTTAPTSGDSGVATAAAASKSPADWGKLLETGKMQSLSAISTMRPDATAPVNVISGTSAGHTAGLITMDPAPPKTAGSKPGERTHTVQKGETLSSIAQVAYGDSGRYQLIIKANPSVNPSRLRPGTVLTIPAITDKPLVVGSTAPSAVIDPAKQYKVQPGDTLEKIASKLYGSSAQWEKIYELNKAKIGSDPQKIKSEMVLALPEAPSKK